MPRAATTKAASCCPPITAAPLTDVAATELSVRFAALSDPVRLRLLSIVASEGEVCSCNLEAPLGKSQPTISHHTRILADAGLIVGERRGRWTWWRVVPEALDRVRASLGVGNGNTGPDVEPKEPSE